ncbi:patatin-like protein [Mycobacterium sp. BK086]|uniref:patatin-like protein n=1 Tax=Mycobacterium sp. BK086 TaxID=2512165 RepID=UPI001060A7D7|nr:patatin-like protein [Mycobacterium sp. BK086]
MGERMTNDRAELRLALVCYGGVSLAVYMHGVTKELQSLIRAAREFDKDLPQNPFRNASPDGTEAAYFDALQDLKAAGHPLSVSIDIVGGTSAGGINGVALAKAMALGASQGPLKDVWIEHGDLRDLLRAPKLFGLVSQALVALIWQAIRFRGPATPLRGELMSQLLLRALQQMDGTPNATTLIPEGGTLDLFVTATDLRGYEVLVPSGAGGASQRDRDNVQVLEFHSEDGEFDKPFTATLAFAGRATASFPGAFAPVTMVSFEDETHTSGMELHPSVFRYQYPDNATANSVPFVDGGVLDNAPFDVVISAIARKRADSQVHRRIIYIEPDPGRPLYAKPDPQRPTKRRYLRDLIAVFGVKGSHPILQELVELRDINAQIGEVSAITDSQERYVHDQLREAFTAVVLAAVGLAEPPDQSGESSTGDGLQALSDAMYRQAQRSLGPAWYTYERLKFEATIERLGKEVARRFGYPSQSGRASFIRTTFVAWARTEPAWLEPYLPDGADSQLSTLLRPTDAPYRERRLLFILAGISAMYTAGADGGPIAPRADLDQLKTTAWNMLEALRTGVTAVVKDLDDVHFLEFDESSPEILIDPTEYAREHNSRFDTLFTSYLEKMNRELGDGSTDLRQAFVTVADGPGWTETARQMLLNRYLGFPLWDGMIFPTLSLTHLPQFTPIGVAQFSPLMATKLKSYDDTGAVTPKLKGIPFHHFGAFLNAKSRENDYLWGRLDGAELILRMLQDVGGAAVAPAGDVPHLAQALQAVLDTESGLKRVKKLREELQAQVTALATANDSSL